MTHDCDVLIVGAGPVGTALALELALHRVSFRIVDREAVRNDKSRALVLQPRTLELLNRHGAADAIVQRGRYLRGGAVYLKKKQATSISFENLGITDTEFTLPLNVSQVEIETFLDECLAKYGLGVERPVTASNIIQDNEGVTATLTRPDGKSETVRSKYVVGCDGAHSVVRHASGKMTFPGAAYPQDYVLCDARLQGSNIPAAHLTVHLDKAGVIATIPVNGELIRVVAVRSSAPNAEQEELTLDGLQAFFTSMTPPGSGTLYNPQWITRFRLHRRCVSQYRDGRLFVAGDAAHIHSPAGGQGMNAGIQDSVNLGWKLAHALSLQDDESNNKSTLPRAQALAAADALLDTYNLERRPVGLQLLNGTDRAFSFVFGSNPLFVPFRNFFLRYVAPRLTRSQGRRRQVFHLMSQLGVNYRGSTRLVGEARGFQRAAIKGSDRLPDGKIWSGAEQRETSLQRVCIGAPHHLLLFAGDAASGGLGGGELEGAAERAAAACKTDVRVHFIAGDDRPVPGDDWYTDRKGELHGKFGFGKKAGYVLVRPDGYVAHIGPLSKLHQLLSFLDGYLVSPVVAASRSRFSFVCRLAWVAVAAFLGFKLVGRIAERFRFA